MRWLGQYCFQWGPLHCYLYSKLMLYIQELWEDLPSGGALKISAISQGVTPGTWESLDFNSRPACTWPHSPPFSASALSHSSAYQLCASVPALCACSSTSLPPGLCQDIFCSKWMEAEDMPGRWGKAGGDSRLDGFRNLLWACICSAWKTAHSLTHSNA